MKDSSDDRTELGKSKSIFKEPFKKRSDEETENKTEPVIIERQIGSIKYRFDSTGSAETDERLFEYMKKMYPPDSLITKSVIEMLKGKYSLQSIPTPYLSHICTSFMPQTNSSGSVDLLIELTKQNGAALLKDVDVSESVLNEIRKQSKTTLIVSYITCVLMVLTIVVPICINSCTNDSVMISDPISADSLLIP